MRESPHGPFSFKPLRDEAERQYGKITNVELLEHLGIPETTMYRLKEKGCSERVADNLAIKLGKHPQDIWGMQWWIEAEAEAETA